MSTLDIFVLAYAVTAAFVLGATPFLYLFFGPVALEFPKYLIKTWTGRVLAILCVFSWIYVWVEIQDELAAEARQALRNRTEEVLYDGFLHHTAWPDGQVWVSRKSPMP